MSEKQNQLFMYVWSRRRARGRLTVAAMGAGIGALGGLLFTSIMFWGSGGSSMSVNEDAVSPMESAIGHAIGPAGLMLVLAVPAFAALGAGLAWRVFGSQEAIYQSLLAQGVEPPATKPVLNGRDRWPQYAVIATVVIIAVFILCVALFVH
ncbi:MAG: hypothetical protein ABUS57_16625 [Pseudomonadota bacterium]